MKKITASILSVLMMLSMVFSSSVFAANEQPSAWESFVGLFSKQATTATTGVEYRGHIQNKGDYPLDGTWIQGPNVLGTTGESLRLEGFWIQLTNKPANVNIQYRVHVQNVGWMAPVQNGKFAGTEGKSQRIEAIEISLVDDKGAKVTGYSVQYKGHIQYQGDTEWLADGAQLGTTGLNRRLEALEVKIVKIEADMTAYDAAVAQAAAAKEEDYTTASYDALTKVVADNVVTKDNTQAEVDAATKAINDAFAALVPGADLTAYNAAVEKAEAVDADLFTTVSYEALEEALADNVVTKDNTADEVAAATAAIEAAIEALVPVADMEAYDAAVAKAEAAVKADYTADSYAALEKALADNVVTNQDSQEDVDAATANINAAYDKLVLIPKLVSVEALNANQILVAFNKAVDKTSAEKLSNYLLNGKVTDGASPATLTSVNTTLSTAATFTQTPKATLQADGKSVLVTLDTVTPGTLQVLESQIAQKLTVENVNDANGTTVAKATKEFTFVDTTVPTVKSVTTEGNRVIVVAFSEFVRPSTAAVASNYQIDGVSLTAYGATTGAYDSEKNEVRFTLSAGLADKTYTFKYSVNNAIKDVVGLKVVEGTTPLIIKADTTPAEISSVEVVTPASGSKYILVSFTKPLASTNFSTGTPLQLDGTNLGTSTTPALTVESGKIKIVGGTAGGAHAINITNDTANYLVDAYGIKVKASSLGYNVTADVTKPTVSTLTVLTGNTQVEVKFSENVESTTATNRLNYTIKNSSNETQAVAGAAYKNGTNDTIVLTMNTALKAGAFSVNIQNVKDAATPANIMDAFNGTLTVVDTVKPTVSSVTYDATSYSVYVTYSKDMNTTTIADAANYLFDNKAIPTGTQITALSNTVAKLKFVDGTALAGKKFAVSTGVTDVSGNPLSGFGYETTLASTFNPTTLDVAVENSVTQVKSTGQRIITVKLNNALELLDASEFQWTTDNSTYYQFDQQNASFTTTDGKSTITFTIPETLPSTSTPSVDKNNTSVTNIKIKAVVSTTVSATKATDGSTLNKSGVIFTAQAPIDKVSPAVKITAGSLALPTAYGVTVSDNNSNGKVDHMNILFSEALKPGSVSIEDFAVSGLAVEDLSLATGTVANDTVVLTLTEGSVADALDTYSVSLKGPIEDSQGNVLAENTSKAYTATNVIGTTALAAVNSVTSGSSTASKTNFEQLGVTGVTTDNLTAVQKAVGNAITAKGGNLTTIAEVQAAANTGASDYSTALAAKTALTNSSMSYTDPAAATSVVINAPADAGGVTYTITAATDTTVSTSIDTNKKFATITRNAGGSSDLTLTVTYGSATVTQHFTATVPGGTTAATVAKV